MELDLFFGVLALSLGAAFSAFSAPLTDIMCEGDDRFLRVRACLLACSAGFVVVGAGLALRGSAV